MGPSRVKLVFMSGSKNTNLLSWSFQSYGAKIRIDSNSQDIIDKAKKVARQSLLSNVKTIGHSQHPDQIIELTKSKSGSYRFLQNGKYLSSGRSQKKFLKFFDTIIRISVGESARNLVFVHAGVVGWKGHAILMPGDSFTGKSTLVAALVKNGAEYYSDDFAILDSEGLVQPFPRAISMRTNDGSYVPYELSVDQLGGTIGQRHIPVALVLLTEYGAKKKWNPKILTPGQGILEIIPFVLPFSKQPEFSLKVLNNVTDNAIIASSPRSNAEHFAKTLLGFFDKMLGKGKIGL